MKSIYKIKDILEKITQEVLDACKVQVEIHLNEQKTVMDLRVPSGDMKYGCFWTRDAAMMVSSGLIPMDEIRTYLHLLAVMGQNGNRKGKFENGLVVPAWAVADHITFDGQPVFYPGTLTPGNDQGDGTYGFYPPHDNQYYFIEITYMYYRLSSDVSFLEKQMGGISLIERLEYAFTSYNIDPSNNLCISSLPHYTVDWGFCDTIIKSGALLFPSLLRYQAALQLEELFIVTGHKENGEWYGKIANDLRDAVLKTFCREDGWFLSATETGRQRDVWGTAFAVWVGILSQEQKERTCKALLEAYHKGFAVNKGYIRHILVGEDASEDSAWQRATSPYNTYQNGGYWAMPIGWYIYALAGVDRKSAVKLLEEFIDHTEQMESHGAPFEWRTQDDREYSGKLYGASAALPYAGLVRMIKEYNF